jgi:hypothetical protein
MMTSQQLLRVWLFLLAFITATYRTAHADPVWHCSRSDVQVADASSDFTLAALSIEREVIRVSLRDLLAIYQGMPVQMAGGLPLSACMLRDDSGLTESALSSIGAKAATAKALTSPTALIKHNVFVVTNESAMHACISQHHPAIGYLPKSTHTEAVGPCF